MNRKVFKIGYRSDKPKSMDTYISILLIEFQYTLQIPNKKTRFSYLHDLINHI